MRDVSVRVSTPSRLLTDLLASAVEGPGLTVSSDAAPAAPDPVVLSVDVTVATADTAHTAASPVVIVLPDAAGRDAAIIVSGVRTTCPAPAPEELHDLVIDVAHRALHIS